MKFKFFPLLTGGLALPLLLAISSSAFGQSTQAQINGKNLQHLTCVEDVQGLMCKVEERDNQLPAKSESVKEAERLQASTTVTAPQLLSPAQMESFCNILLGILYFVLPTGLALAVFLHDKHDNYLSQQIAYLEKLWEQNSHN